jgi:uncharacterized protein YbjT (DUF2867 family)
MYAVLGITGKVGGAVARHLLNRGAPVRAIVREISKGEAWASLGCDVSIADVEDPAALSRALSGVTGAFLMTPPNFDPEPHFPQIQRRISAMTEAITEAAPGKVVFLSTVGAHVTEPTLLTNSHMIERALRGLPVPTTFLRAGWFMENAQWDIESARSGEIHSFLQPLDHPIPMIATDDIGRVAADILLDSSRDNNVVELEAEQRYSANDIGTAFAAALERPVHIKAVPRTDWDRLFRAQGMKNPSPRMRMLDGFNEGWIDFEGGAIERRYGSITLNEAISKILAQ